MYFIFLTCYFYKNSNEENTNMYDIVTFTGTWFGLVFQEFNAVFKNVFSHIMVAGYDIKARPNDIV